MGDLRMDNAWWTVKNGEVILDPGDAQEPSSSEPPFSVN
jgi:hypothetical protein